VENRVLLQHFIVFDRFVEVPLKPGDGHPAGGSAAALAFIIDRRITRLIRSFE
jgi:hypothetical protein